MVRLSHQMLSSQRRVRVCCSNHKSEEQEKEHSVLGIILESHTLAA